MSESYDTYLKSDEWKDLRTRILKRDGKRCVLCNRKATRVHHRTYERITKEVDEDLVSLCENCHTLFHNNYKVLHSHHVPLNSTHPPQPKEPSPSSRKKEPLTESRMSFLFVSTLEKKGGSKSKKKSPVFARKIINHPYWNGMRRKILSCDSDSFDFIVAKSIIKGTPDLLQTPSEAGCLSSLWNMALTKRA